MKQETKEKCPICQSDWIMPQGVFPELFECFTCGSEWRENGEIIFNARTYEK